MISGAILHRLLRRPDPLPAVLAALREREADWRRWSHIYEAWARADEARECAEIVEAVMRKEPR